MYNQQREERQNERNNNVIQINIHGVEISAPRKDHGFTFFISN